MPTLFRIFGFPPFMFYLFIAVASLGMIKCRRLYGTVAYRGLAAYRQTDPARPGHADMRMDGAV